MSGARVIATAHPLRDQHGDIAQLHGIGILRVGDRFFAWGEDKRNGGAFSAIACYSSADLVDWRREGDSLIAGQGAAPGTEGRLAGLAHADTDLAAGRVIERPKVLRHPRTGRYVMLVHVDAPDYSDARVGFASSDDPIGPYAYHGSIRPLGHLSRDIGVYAEGEKAYLLSEDRERGLHVYRLRDDLLGDRWMPDALAESLPVWLPLEVGGGQAQLRWAAQWSIDVVTGEVAACGAPAAEPYEKTERSA